MLIDCDTCTVRGAGCDDCVVTVLLGPPPGWRDSEPTVVPLTRPPGRGRDAGVAVVGAAVAGAPTPGGSEAAGAVGRAHHAGGEVEPRPIVELDDVERRAVGALADFGLVPPLRHQDASHGAPRRDMRENRHVS